MENRAYEDEPSKSVHRYQHHHQQQPQQYPHFHHQQQHQQHQFNFLQHRHHQPCEHNNNHYHRSSHNHRYDPYRTGMEMVHHHQHGSNVNGNISDCHVYEDIVAPYGLALDPGGGCGGSSNGFHRNLTLPLRRPSQSCESIEGVSSSVRVTSRERTRGSVIDRLARDDRNRGSSSSSNSSRDESSLASGGAGVFSGGAAAVGSSLSVERPTRRRRKKDCKHCSKVKQGAGSSDLVGVASAGVPNANADGEGCGRGVDVDDNEDTSTLVASDRANPRSCGQSRRVEEEQEQLEQEQEEEDELAAVAAAYEERNAAELRAIFGLPGLAAAATGPPGCLGGGVVYAIGCNGTDCNGSIVSSSGGGTTNSDSTTTTAVASTVPRFVGPEVVGPYGLVVDDKTLIAPLALGGKVTAAAVPGLTVPNTSIQAHGAAGFVAGTRAAGMKVNSIYAQEHWHAAAKDPRIFLHDPKDQHCNSPFQRAYAAVSANSPISDNRANLRRSARDEPAPHPARLRKHRHGWTLQFGRQGFANANCTKSLVLLLILVLALLGIGGFALYIVFEPEKLHVIQQYLRSSARNDSGIGGSAGGGGGGGGVEHTFTSSAIPINYDYNNNNDNYVTTTNINENRRHPSTGYEEPASSYTPTSSQLDANSLLNGGGNSLNSNAANDLDDLLMIVKPAAPASSTQRPSTTGTTSTTTTVRTTARTSTTTPRPTTSSTTTSTTTTTTTTTLAPVASSTTRLFLEAHSRRRRACSECYNDEVCVARNADETPFCRAPLDLTAGDGCGGLCDSKTQKCHKLEAGAHRCTEMEHHCLDDEWTCHNIFCIPLVKRCDGQMNCYDHSDEYNCECNLETHFHCGNQTSCLPLSKKCDGHVDCFDATDEENCTTSHELGRLCPSKDEFTCRNKQQCIRRSRFCDGYRDCKDGSDEPHGCQGRCNKHEFTCHNGRCINKADKCNGIDDCGDGSDEQHCRERL